MDAQYGDKFFEGIQKIRVYLNFVGQTYFQKDIDKLFFGSSLYLDEYNNNLEKLNLATGGIILLGTV